MSKVLLDKLESGNTVFLADSEFDRRELQARLAVLLSKRDFSKSKVPRSISAFLSHQLIPDKASLEK
jgi:hypothetical protein